MALTHHHNPLRFLAAITILILAIFFVGDGHLGQFLPHRPSGAEAIGGYAASTVLTSTTAAVKASVDAVHHRLFVAEYANARVLVYDLDSNNVPLDDSPDYVLGQADLSGTLENRGGGTAANTLASPNDVSYDSSHDLLFVADYGNSRVLVYDTDTIIDGEDAINVIGQIDDDDDDDSFDSNAAVVSENGLDHVVGISIEPLNNLLAVSDGASRVLIFDLSGGITNGMPATRVFGQSNFTDFDSGTGIASMSIAYRIMIETNTDSLWVADRGNNRVLRFDLFGSTGSDATAVLGQIDDGDPFDSSTVGSGAAGMNAPTGVTLIERDDDTQRLLVTDQNNNRILSFDTSDGVINGEDAVDVYGQADLVGNGSGGGLNQLDGPDGIDYDEDTNTLYVPDPNNARLLIFAPPAESGGSSQQPPTIRPQRLVVNDDAESTSTNAVMVTVYAATDAGFGRAVEVMLSNEPDFSTYVPFAFSGGSAWPKIIPWDLCFGVSDGHCVPGTRQVYGRILLK